MWDACVHSDQGASFKEKHLKDSLTQKGVATSKTTFHPIDSGQAARPNGTLWKAIHLLLESHNLPVQHWESVLADVLHSVRSLLSTSTIFLKFSTLMAYVSRRFVWVNKTEPWVDEVGLVWVLIPHIPDKTAEVTKNQVAKRQAEEELELTLSRITTLTIKPSSRVNTAHRREKQRSLIRHFSSSLLPAEKDSWRTAHNIARISLASCTDITYGNQAILRWIYHLRPVDHDSSSLCLWITTIKCHCRDWRAQLGTTTETSVTQNRSVSQIIVYECYNRTSYLDSDIALIKLTSPIAFPADNKIAPVCLPDAGNLYENVAATITGWGQIFLGGPQNFNLYEVDVVTVNNEQCQLDNLPYQVTTNMICAGNAAGGNGTCKGDSGGALVTYGNTAQTYMFQIGIDSWAIGCSLPNKPTVYTRVSIFLPWIATNTAGSTYLPRP
ncbi:transmembrane protease serine 11D-like [Macrobrachium nipponense]|uniref:transmembrane protease serine 11D-like n=1 Tax=Macrobrachium nipponense TaxID=159736 RepID=UPI0030C80FC0